MDIKVKHPPAHFIESEIRRCGMEIKHTSSNIMIPCPFHRETHPSLSISLGSKVPSGIFKCFGCEAKGTWNKLAKRLGLRQWNSNDDNEIFVVKTKKELNKELKLDNLKLSDWDGTYKWKTYSHEFLSTFGAKLLYDSLYKCNYLYLPIQYLNDIYGYCKVRLNEKDPGPKYWFSPNMSKVMYPIDYIRNKVVTDCIVLVEGMGDAFRLIKNGIPSIALLGVELTSFMIEQLENLAARNIILCLDGDDAGKRAIFGDENKEGLASKLDKLGYNVRVLRPPNSTDPDDMPIKYVHALGKLCESLGGPKYIRKINEKDKDK